MFCSPVLVQRWLILIKWNKEERLTGFVYLISLLSYLEGAFPISSPLCKSIQPRCRNLDPSYRSVYMWVLMHQLRILSCSFLWLRRLTEARQSSREEGWTRFHHPCQEHLKRVHRKRKRKVIWTINSLWTIFRCGLSHVQMLFSILVHATTTLSTCKSKTCKR